MNSLIFISPVVNKFLTFFRAIFGELTKPAKMSMSLLVLGIVVTSDFQKTSLRNQRIKEPSSMAIAS